LEKKEWLPPYFEYRAGELWLEEVDLEDLARQFGTPCYVYSAGAIRAAYRRYREGFAGARVKLDLCYAVKANSNLAILGLLGELGAGADVVSAGELYRAIKAGIPAGKIVFAGVGKTAAEIDYALERNIRAFNLESAGEMALLDRRAQALGKTGVGVSLRFNPDVEAHTHPYITTGKNFNKFGLPAATVRQLGLELQQSPALRLRGLQMHIGSQLLQIEPVLEAFEKLLDLTAQVEELTGQNLEYLDIGGGLGASYSGEIPPKPAELAEALAGAMRKRAKTYSLLAEPGRYLVAEAGALLTEVLYLKAGEAAEGGANFAIVDAGMNDLIRPALYQASHKIVPLKVQKGRDQRTYEVVGPVCETGDWLGRGVILPELSGGERLAILSAGAYGFTMASNYNSRPRPPEILVDGSAVRLIRRRETFEDLVAGESL
jgi:diaminopimelate decarboxylase